MDDEDDWRNVLIRNKKLRFKWIGQTVFKIKPAREPAPSGDGSFPSMPVVPDNDSEHREKLAKSAPISEDEIVSSWPWSQGQLARKSLCRTQRLRLRLTLNGKS